MKLNKIRNNVDNSIVSKIKVTLILS